MTAPTNKFVDLLKFPQIIGKLKASAPALIPICVPFCWARGKSGFSPKPVKISPRVTVGWAQDIRDLIDRVSQGAA